MKAARPACRVPAQGDRATAMALVSSILMALIHRMKTGEGSWVGTSLLGNGLWSCGVIAQAALVGAYLPHRPPPDRPRSALGNIYRTSDDRWLQLTIVREDKMWRRLLRDAWAVASLPDDPRFATSRTERKRNSAELWRTILSDAFAHPALRALARGAGRATASPSASSAGRRTCPTTSRPSPAAPWSRPRSPTCRAPWPIRSASASPSSGSPMPRRRSASTATRSCARPGMSAAEIAALKTAGAMPMSEPLLPLAGLVVLDVSTFIAAPAAAVALADYGADVIKIEAPGEGDPHRHNYKRAATYPRSDKNFPLQLDGRLKRSLALDLKNAGSASGARETDPARRHHDRQLPAAGARAPQAALGGYRAAQPAPGLLPRSPATARPGPTATGRAST